MCTKFMTQKVSETVNRAITMLKEYPIKCHAEIHYLNVVIYVQEWYMLFSLKLCQVFGTKEFWKSFKMFWQTYSNNILRETSDNDFANFDICFDK